jgi:DnaJ domain
MTERYSRNYRILGIQPGVSWKQLRQAYKRLVNTWHPDRFQQDTRRRKMAEEKTKDITQSYKELAEYYKRFGVLPMDAEKTVTPMAEDITPQNVPDTPSERENQHTKPPAVTPMPWRSTLTGRIIVTVAVISVAYFMWLLIPSEQPDQLEQNGNPPALEEHTDHPSDTPDDQYSSPQTSAEKQFTIGSSLGEVYAIQGVPTKTENDIWYYGNSKVYFSRGRVSRWEESSDHLLRVRITPGAEKSTAKFFSKGSSKEEVRAVQGAPDRDAGSVWDYGLSRVYFEKDHVTGWNEVPLNPLRVRP